MKKSTAIITVLVIAAMLVCVSFYTGSKLDSISAANELVAQADANGEDSVAVAREQNAKILGILTILPPLVAIVLAFLTKQVVVSLLTGAVTGIYIVQAINSPGAGNIFSVIFHTFLETCNSMIANLADSWDAGIVMQVLCIGGLIALITKMGGARAVAEALARRAHTSRGAMLITWVMGLFVFFDDYANSLIVGPVMRPVTDKMKISREKLSFVVDATAAPVAGIALISTWIATELSAIQQGYELAGDAGAAAVETVGGYYSTFVQTIPFRFYNIFALMFIVISAFMLKEFGPMLKAEVRARKFGQVVREGSQPMVSDEITNLEPTETGSLKMRNAIVPILVLIIGSFLGFYYNGFVGALGDGALEAGAPLMAWDTIQTAFSYADASVVLFQAAMLACIVAILMGMQQKIFSLSEGINVWLEGVKSFIITAVILILAWTLTGAIKDIGTNYFIVGAVSGFLPYWLLPTLIFVIACLISFATGTSYGTMLIVTPLTIPIALNLIAQHSVADPNAYLLGTIGAVLSGAIFGDHCSPISDTTILSSMGAGVDHLDHVRTQLPYALFCAGISIVCGTLLTGFGLSAWISLAAGVVVMAVCLAVFGRNPDKEALKD